MEQVKIFRLTNPSLRDNEATINAWLKENPAQITRVLQSSPCAGDTVITIFYVAK